MELTKQFSEQQYARALESWSWLDLDRKVPRFTSLFGDVFLESADGAWWFLDTFEGHLLRGWNTRADLTAELDAEAGEDRYLLASLAMAAYHRRGLRLDAGQTYAYAPPPIVTGSFDVDRIDVFGFVPVVQSRWPAPRAATEQAHLGAGGVDTVGGPGPWFRLGTACGAGDSACASVSLVTRAGLLGQVMGAGPRRFRAVRPDRDGSSGRRSHDQSGKRLPAWRPRLPPGTRLTTSEMLSLTCVGVLPRERDNPRRGDADRSCRLLRTGSGSCRGAGAGCRRRRSAPTPIRAPAAFSLPRCCPTPRLQALRASSGQVRARLLPRALIRRLFLPSFEDAALSLSALLSTAQGGSPWPRRWVSLASGSIAVPVQLPRVSGVALGGRRCACRSYR